MKPQTKTLWKTSYWTLLVLWIVGAALNMAHVRGGFFTNYLSDLAFPPWFYIFLRGLSSDRIPKIILFGDWFGRSPERAAISIFLVGVISEVKTLYWPLGPIAGTFDTWDIAAYGVGLVVCYYFDKKAGRQ